jgi:hypothetical protein
MVDVDRQQARTVAGVEVDAPRGGLVGESIRLIHGVSPNGRYGYQLRTKNGGM